MNCTHEKTQRYKFEFDSYGHNLSSYVDRAPHKVLLLLAILQEDPETNEGLSTIVFLVYMTKVGVQTSSLNLNPQEPSLAQ